MRKYRVESIRFLDLLSPLIPISIPLKGASKNGKSHSRAREKVNDDKFSLVLLVYYISWSLKALDGDKMGLESH